MICHVIDMQLGFVESVCKIIDYKLIEQKLPKFAAAFSVLLICFVATAATSNFHYFNKFDFLKSVFYLRLSKYIDVYL